jgi:bifunctional DNase/RNase
MAVEMELVSVEAPERPTRTPVVILRETGGQRRVLPIFIGTPEAQAIALSMQNIETPRPMTHDLMKNLLDEVGARVERITVTALRDGTFYAEIALTAQGEVRTVSSRPSDAIALAVRTGSPIFAEEGVLDEAGQDAEVEAAEEEVLDEAGRVEQPDEEQAEQMVEEFRAFIDHVNPEDFAL